MIACYFWCIRLKLILYNRFVCDLYTPRLFKYTNLLKTWLLGVVPVFPVYK